MTKASRIIFDAHRIISAIAYYIRVMGFARQLDADSAAQAEAKLTAQGIRFEVSRFDWRHMTDDERMDFIASRTPGIKLRIVRDQRGKGAATIHVEPSSENPREK